MSTWTLRVAADGHIAVRNPALLEQEVPVTTHGAMTDASKRAKPSDALVLELVGLHEALAGPLRRVTPRTPEGRRMCTLPKSLLLLAEDEGAGQITAVDRTMTR